jgi:AraC-like DNA-binding protein/quercetin dioxygenase-like cupin family protein
VSGAARADGVHAVIQHRSALRGLEALTLRTDHTFPRHSHDDFGIGVITEGAQRSWSGLGPVESAAGDVITVNPGEVHDGAPLGGGPRGWRMLYVDPAVVARETAEEGLARPALRDPVLAGLFARLFARATADAAPDQLALEEDLLRTLRHLLRHHGAQPPHGATPASPAVAAARRRLDEAPHLPVTLAELAALACSSRFALLRGFAREVGATPHAYLVGRRVLLARRLLAARHSPAEAALLAGFADQSHLTRAFRHHLGTTPARYRAALLA